MTADQLAQLLDELSSRLDGPARHVFELAVKAQLINGFTVLAITVIGLGLGIVFLISALRNWDEAKADFNDKGAVYICLAVIAGLFGGFAFILLIATGIQQLLNPEYVALKDIITTLLPGH